MHPLDQESFACLLQDEAVAGIEIPQVFEQPTLKQVQHGRVAHVEAHIATAYRTFLNSEKESFGPSFQLLASEFQPILSWAEGCWDFLLTTEGCRFLRRPSNSHYGIRGDYRAFTQKDFHRLVQRVFRECLISFSQQPELPAFAPWLREFLWPLVLKAYHALQYPTDKRQRPLTAYSYLRCVPYRFMNDVHQDRVTLAYGGLTQHQYRALNRYFMHFYTLEITAEYLNSTPVECQAIIAQGLETIRRRDSLAYYLLRQIERY